MTPAAGEEEEDLRLRLLPPLRLLLLLSEGCSEEEAPGAVAPSASGDQVVAVAAAAAAARRGAEVSSTLPRRPPSACSIASDTGRPAGSDGMVAPALRGTWVGPTIPFAKRECTPYVLYVCTWRRLVVKGEGGERGAGGSVFLFFVRMREQ